MSKLVEIKPEEFVVSPFQAINDAMLIAAELDGKVNAMAASWGGLGVMWHKNVVFAVIRPQRYTREFVDGSDTFSCNFFAPARKDMVNYFGSVSGRKEDKIAKAGLTVERADGTPYFAEASATLLCRKLYAQPYESRFFVDTRFDAEYYAKKDYHTMYIGEIVRILAAKE